MRGDQSLRGDVTAIAVTAQDTHVINPPWESRDIWICQLLGQLLGQLFGQLLGQPFGQLLGQLFGQLLG